MTFYRYAAAAGLLCSATSISAQGVSTDCLSQIYGQECGERLNTITTAVPFLMIGPDSRSGGMGDAGVALPADANAIHWNPSKLAFAENKSEIKISISPWLRNLVPDMSLAYVAAYSKLKNKRSAIGGSLRYFNLGSITFTDVNGQVIRDFKPAEFAVDVAFAQQFSDVFSGGIALRYINSNLTGGLNVSGANTKAGQSVAADVSFLYQKPQLELGDIDGIFAFGVNISNIDNRGDVHPDTMWWHHKLGNVRQRPFSQIWSDTSDPLMAGLKASPRTVGGRCGECAYFAVCNGNTRVRAHQTTGDAWAEDPGCYLTDAEIGLTTAATVATEATV